MEIFLSIAHFENYYVDRNLHNYTTRCISLNNIIQLYRTSYIYIYIYIFRYTSKASRVENANPRIAGRYARCGFTQLEVRRAVARFSQNGFWTSPAHPDVHNEIHKIRMDSKVAHGQS